MPSSPTIETDVAIVGAGLSGLHSAWLLTQADIECVVLEARSRVGGRAMAWNNQEANDGGRFDLGPSWFWPGQQRMEKLVQALGLADQQFAQHAQGRNIFEDQQGAVRSDVTGMSMAGSWRMAGGIQQITDRLNAALPPDSVRLNSPVTRVSASPDDTEFIQLTTSGTESVSIHCRAVVLALPPRLVAHGIRFDPELPDQRLFRLNAVQTWMAGQAKFVAEYDAPHWRNVGFSGDGFSLRGPLREIHDASIDQHERFALFGFVGTPAAEQLRDPEGIATASLDQLQRLFSIPNNSVTGWQLKDWAADQFTSTPKDSTEAPVHQTQSLYPVIEPEWPGKIIWSGSETADGRFRNNGYLEGAVEASERTVALLVNALAARWRSADGPT